MDPFFIRVFFILYVQVLFFFINVNQFSQVTMGTILTYC